MKNEDLLDKALRLFDKMMKFVRSERLREKN